MIRWLSGKQDETLDRAGMEGDFDFNRKENKVAGRVKEKK